MKCGDMLPGKWVSLIEYCLNVCWSHNNHGDVPMIDRLAKEEGKRDGRNCRNLISSPHLLFFLLKKSVPQYSRIWRNVFEYFMYYICIIISCIILYYNLLGIIMNTLGRVLLWPTTSLKSIKTSKRVYKWNRIYRWNRQKTVWMVEINSIQI